MTIRPMDIQEEHDLDREWAALKGEPRFPERTPAQIAQDKAMIEAAWAEQNGDASSTNTSTPPRDLVELVMQSHGVSREKAERMIDESGVY